MTKEERLEKMKVGRYLPRHAIVAADVLEAIKKEAGKRNVVIVDDDYWPWHVLAAGSLIGQLISLYCKGFRRNIDVQPLTTKVLADLRYKEMVFMTPTGAISYVIKLQKKWREPK